MVILRRAKDDEAYNIATHLGMTRLYKGKVGLEIEVEGNKFKREGLPKEWEYHKDGSLRGKDNAEYVLAEPLDFDKADKAVDSIFKDMTKYGSRLDDSNRTSVHVHLNIQDFFLNRLTALMALYIILEEPLTEWCGEHRVGNLFCLRSKDAPGIITHLRRFIRSDMTYPLRDGMHYSGMNAQAVVKRGSLEFRTLRGTNDPLVIKQWVAVLRRLYDLSEAYVDPRFICESFSQTGPLQFFDDILGEQAAVVKAGIGMSDDQIRESMYEGVRLAQDLCYAKDWDRFKAIKSRTNPFGVEPKVLKRRREGPTEGPGFTPVNVLQQAQLIIQGVNGLNLPPVNFGDLQ